MEMDFNECDEAEVNGTLLFLIRIMRAMGIASVHIQKHGSIHYIRMSSLFTSKFVGLSIVAVLCALTGIGLIWDICIKDTEGALRVETPSSAVLWLSDLGLTTIISSLGAYGASKRMRHVIRYLNNIKKSKSRMKDESLSIFQVTQKQRQNHANLVINVQLSGDNKIIQKHTIIVNTLVALNLMVLFCGSSMHFYISLNNEMDHFSHMLIMLFYSAVYPEYFITCTLGMLLIYIARLVNSALHAVNCDLKNIITNLENEKVEFSRENEIYDISHKISLKSINKVIDQIGALEVKRLVSALSMKNETKLHQLMIQYIRISDTVAMINKYEGTLMFIILMSLTFDFVDTAYDLVTTIILSVHLTNWKYFLVNHCTWITLTFFNIIAFIDACHRITTEMKRTRALVGCLLCHVISSSDPLNKELDIFIHQLYLFKLKYSLMSMLTLNRNLIVTIMSVAATYVFIFIEFGFEMKFTPH